MFQTRAPLFGSLVALGLLGSVLASSAHADTILETAQFTGVDTGEYIVHEDRFIGAIFTVSSQTQITGIGGEFGGFPAGTIFGAIIALSSPSAFPSVTPDQLPSITVAETVFSLVGRVPAKEGTGADIIEPLSATLNAGTYAVLFGSGLFGADGNGGLGWQNTPSGSPTYLQNFFGDWASFDDPGVRIVVEGSASPVPGPIVGAGFPGAAFAFGGLVGWWRRARRARTMQG